MTKNKKITYIVITSVAIVIALGLIFYFNSSQILRAVGITKTAPVFTFNESKAPGWWGGENYNSKISVPNDSNDKEFVDKMPTASITIFKGKKGEYKTDCFVMFSYYDYKVDIAQIKKEQADGYAASKTANYIGQNTVSINALGSTKSLTIDKYELVGADSQNTMKGMSYGYIDSGNGYISMSGICPTGAELDGTLSMINGVSLTKE